MTSRSLRGALAALSLATLLPSLATSAANIALPALTRAFDAPFQQVQWVVLANLLATTAAIVGAGRLGDLLGRRRLLLAGLLLFAAASAACGLVTSLPALVAARAVQGLGAAVMLALSIALVTETVPKGSTGRAMGLIGTMSAVGTALGPSLGGVLIALFDWRAIFLVNVPLALAAFALAHRHLPSGAAEGARASARFDTGGTVLLAVTLSAYALAMTYGRGRMGVMNAALMAASAIGAAVFVAWERHVRWPLIDATLLREASLRTALVTTAIVSTVLMATLVVGPFYLSYALGLDAARTGAVMSAGPLAAALAGVPAGRIVDRLGPARMTVIGLAAVAAGCFVLSRLPITAGIPGYVAPMVLVTASYALFQAANNTGVMAGVPADRRGVMSGILNLSRNLGLITGASLMGAVFAWAAGTSDLAAAGAPAIAHGARTTFGVAGGLAAVGVVMGVNARFRPKAEATRRGTAPLPRGMSYD